jgi:hypothetical protein
MQMLYEKACEGNMAAAKMYLSYTAGKAAPSPDPDRLTLDEWDIYRKMPVLKEDFKAAFNAYLGEAVCEVMRICLPFLIDHQAKQLARMLLGPTPAVEPASPSQEGNPAAQTPSNERPAGRPAVPAAAAPHEAPPSTDGDNGAAAASSEAKTPDSVAAVIGGDIPIDVLLAALQSGDIGLLQCRPPNPPPSANDAIGRPPRARRKKKRRK